MLSVFLLAALVPSVYPCSATSGSSGKSDDLIVKFDNVKELPIEFVVYNSGTDLNVRARAPKNKEDVATNIGNKLQNLMHVGFLEGYDPSYEAGLANFVVKSPVKYVPLQCDFVNYPNMMPVLAGGSATISAGNVCMLSPSLNSVIKVCQYPAANTDIAKECTNDKYKVIDSKYLTFEETVEIDFPNDNYGTKVQRLRSGFNTYKTAVQNSIQKHLTAYCNGAFRASDVVLDFKQ